MDPEDLGFVRFRPFFGLLRPPSFGLQGIHRIFVRYGSLGIFAVIKVWIKGLTRPNSYSLASSVSNSIGFHPFRTMEYIWTMEYMPLTNRKKEIRRFAGVYAIEIQK